jgi:putative ABC transport system ATP-binding protein
MVTHDEREARRTHRIMRLFDGQLVTPEHLHVA